DTNINYRFSLPNKIFDYVHAGVPVLASPLTEIRSFIEKYNVGVCIESHDAKHIAGKMNFMLSSAEYPVWKANTKKAAEENSWENEKRTWISMINEIKKN
ncbi:MAG TPA: glycosyltransferase, partial [Bacteroidia bacterium]|nr:glycosyltransferase [Bacteroidia bacterium]